ncbi:hypothetical protein F383_30683 [Gossypium arboreum]|uniref:Uncharacterized protein n=1 Tax=Gossypium arboreum TaxID=29729 RepID=A0A0B0PL17_GOSAR|nr:hypothetical protein F383_29484 [Gossypium arboreum]KHG24086.1 hypothetical protein F383_30683 [Gossypium arboreum]
MKRKEVRCIELWISALSVRV